MSTYTNAFAFTQLCGVLCAPWNGLILDRHKRGKAHLPEGNRPRPREPTLGTQHGGCPCCAHVAGGHRGGALAPVLLGDKSASALTQLGLGVGPHSPLTLLYQGIWPQCVLTRSIQGCVFSMS